MAATLWRTVLAGEVALATLLTAIVMSVAQPNAWIALPIALAALLLIQFLLVATSTVASLAMREASDPGRSLAGTARSVILETMHFGLALLAMSADRSPLKGERRRDTSGTPTRPVLLVHGLACNRGVWRWLLRRLRRAGFNCVHSPNLQPVRADIDRLAELLESEVLRVHHACAGARVTIIAHSMGGLAARALLRSLGPDVIRQIITLATPHHGARFARLLTWPCTKQMCPGSTWLGTLNAAQEGHWRVPLTSIYSLDDNLVAPARSSALLGAQCYEMRGIGHFGVLVSRPALDYVMSVLEGRL